MHDISSNRGGAGWAQAARPRRIMGRLAILLAFTAFPLAAHAVMYKCVDANGASRYQDTPCDRGAHDQTNDLSNPGRDTSPAPAPSPGYNPNPGNVPEVTLHEYPPLKPLDQNQLKALRPQETDADQPGAGDSAADSAADQPGADDSAAATKQDVVAAIKGLVIRAAVYVFFAALLGWRASARNRSFWKWFILALIFTPGLMALIFLVFRGQDPERPAWAGR